MQGGRAGEAQYWLELGVDVRWGTREVLCIVALGRRAVSPRACVCFRHGGDGSNRSFSDEIRNGSRGRTVRQDNPGVGMEARRLEARSGVSDTLLMDK